MSGRIRSLKPEWLEDEPLVACSSDARVLSAALIVLADDYGNGRGGELFLTSRVFPGKSRETLARALEELVRIRYVELYEIDGQRYFSIRNWKKHQRVDHPGKPIVPKKPDASRESREGLASPPESLEVDLRPTTDEGKGGDLPPPPEEPARPLPRDPFGDSLRGKRTQDDPDVLRLFEAWKVAHGFSGAKFRQPADARADILHEALATHGMAPCLAVLEASKTDGMVTGKTDEHGEEHRSVEYLFKPATFDRLLRAAEQRKRKRNPTGFDPVAAARDAEPDLSDYKPPTVTQ